jgi:short-subunit dehydrogenase
MSLEGKSVFITGGSGGIGQPLIKLLEAEGLLINAYDHEKNGDMVQSLDSIVQALKDETPDILINLAGVNQFSSCEEQDYRRLIDINLIVPMTLIQAVIPGMVSRGHGHIVNIGSMVAEIPMPFLSGYVASKSGLKGFSESIRREVANQGITVTHINPRAVKTSMNHGAMELFNKKTKASQDNPEWVAEQIFKAIKNGTKRKSLGASERFFAKINALMPDLVDKAMSKQRLAALEVLSTPKLPQ